jgi:hypothetical protein
MKFKELLEQGEHHDLFQSLMGDPGSAVHAGGFDCSGKEINSLEGCPKEITGGFWCGTNNLKSLKGGPETVGKQYSCSYNKLESLEGIASIIAAGNLSARNNKLKSLEGIHKHIKILNGAANFLGNPISSHVLGVMRIKGLTSIFLDNDEVTTILNKHLKGDRDIFACQEELIDVGFEEFAKL